MRNDHAGRIAVLAARLARRYPSLDVGDAALLAWRVLKLQENYTRHADRVASGELVGNALHRSKKQLRSRGTQWLADSAAALGPGVMLPRLIEYTRELVMRLPGEPG